GCSPGGVFGDLRHHGRNQIERLVYLGEFVQHADHAGVILQGVQARPGQFILAGPQILVERLVHVPQETKCRHWLGGSAEKGALFGVETNAAASEREEKSKTVMGRRLRISSMVR